MAKSEEYYDVKVMVSHLQLDDGIYRKGDIISLPTSRIVSLGSSVAVIRTPEPEPEYTPPPPRKKPTKEEEEEEPKPAKKTSPPKGKGKGK